MASIRDLFCPPGLFIVMVGPDGSGKTTAGRSLQEKLASTFCAEHGCYYHWKARLVKQETVPTGPPRENPHGDPERSKIASVVFFLAHIVDLVIAHWVKVYPKTVKNGVVLIDRYYYDFFVDPRRYRLNLPVWLAKAVYWLVPKPDIIFFFEASADVFQSRKKEVSFEECTRQSNAYRELAKQLSQSIVIDAALSMDEVSNNVHQEVLKFVKNRKGTLC